MIYGLEISHINFVGDLEAYIMSSRLFAGVNVITAEHLPCITISISRMLIKEYLFIYKAG